MLNSSGELNMPRSPDTILENATQNNPPINVNSVDLQQITEMLHTVDSEYKKSARNVVQNDDNSQLQELKKS